MEKPADAQHPIHELIQRRWSPRAFADRPVEPHTLQSLLEAARWAPSAYNEQPWRFLIATLDDPVGYERLFSCLSEGNRRWASRAPVLLLSAAKRNFEHNQKENRHAFHDVGLAVGNLLVQATALGLSVHQMAGFDRKRARQALDIPEGYEPVAMIALGYPGDPATLPKDLYRRELAPREREPLERFAFTDRWEQPWLPAIQS